MTTTPDPETAREIARNRQPHDSWYDDAPVTDRQLDVVRGDLENGCIRFHAVVVRKLVQSVEQLRASQLDEQPQAEPSRYPDSHSPWSQWLTDQLLDHEWVASGLVEASGHVFDVKQVSRWLHSQDTPEPWAAVLAAKALGASAVEALRAAEHGVVVDAVLAEHEQLHDEYGLRADFTDTTSAEFTVADNLGDALEALAEFDAKHGGRVVSRELVERPVGGWRKIGEDRG